MNDNLDEIENTSLSMDNCIRRLLDLSTDGEGEVRVRSLEALQYIRTPEVEHRITNALLDADELVRTTCVEILGSWKDQRYVSNIISRFSDASWLVRSASAIALAEIGAVDAIRTLLERLANVEDDEEKVSLYYALYKLGENDYIFPFLDGLFHEFYRIRCATANLCVQILNSSNRNFILDLLLVVLKTERTKAAQSSIKNAIAFIEVSQNTEAP